MIFNQSRLQCTHQYCFWYNHCALYYYQAFSKNTTYFRWSSYLWSSHLYLIYCMIGTFKTLLPSVLSVIFWAAASFLLFSNALTTSICAYLSLALAFDNTAYQCTDFTLSGWMNFESGACSLMYYHITIIMFHKSAYLL